MNITNKIIEMEKIIRDKYGSDEEKHSNDDEINKIENYFVSLRLDSGEIIEPCEILEETESYIDLLLVPRYADNVSSLCIDKKYIVGFGSYTGPIEWASTTQEEEKIPAVPKNLYL